MRPELLQPDGELTEQVTADALSLAGVTVPPDRIRVWTLMERLLAYDWALREHLRASDNLIRERAKPSFVTAAETVGSA